MNLKILLILSVHSFAKVNLYYSAVWWIKVGGAHYLDNSRWVPYPPLSIGKKRQFGCGGSGIWASKVLTKSCTICR